VNEAEARAKSLALMERSQIALVGSNGDDGHPWIKAMLKWETEELRRVHFSTNTSSKRVAQFRADPRACVYFVDFCDWMGLLLVGEMEVLDDPDLKLRLWHDGDEQYYPLGPSDPDYSVLRFTAGKANYYHRLENVDFVP
jgi:general stress protein 26